MVAYLAVGFSGIAILLSITALLFRRADKLRAQERQFMLQMMTIAKAGSATEAAQVVAMQQSVEDAKDNAKRMFTPSEEIEAELPAERVIDGKKYELMTLESLR